MLTPSDLRQGAAVVGLEPNIVVTIAATAPAGDAVTVFYRLPDGSPRDRLLTPADLASLSLATTDRPSSFDGDAEAFQLARVARRLHAVACKAKKPPAEHLDVMSDSLKRHRESRTTPASPAVRQRSRSIRTFAHFEQFAWKAS